MKLQFDKGGRRFFFLTFCVRGRRPVLSRIVKKTERDGRPGYAVELLPAGEAMAALWRGIHARKPFLTGEWDDFVFPAETRRRREGMIQ
ncbi:MAG: hypothetical protein IKU71_06850 [Kiritimatiellae bacterium]|nr:hypothetical protein [Kiritimatiellia bacterium]